MREQDDTHSKAANVVDLNDLARSITSRIYLFFLVWHCPINYLFLILAFMYLDNIKKQKKAGNFQFGKDKNKMLVHVFFMLPEF